MTVVRGAPNPKDLVGAKKAPLSLVPAALVIGAAEAAQNGADKYGPFNWREYPVQVMTYVEAMQRHLAAFVDGQDIAEDTGIHHLKHVAAGLGILLDSIAMGIAIDNRPPFGPASDLLRAADRSAKLSEPTVPEVIADDETTFLCGHHFGEQPILMGSGGNPCGTAIHWSPVNGVTKR